MKILIVVTTYNRPDGLLNLLTELKKDTLSEHIHFLIFDDGSKLSYNKVIAYLKKNFSFDFFRNEINQGKSNYWQIVNAAFQAVKLHEFDYFLMLPDDVGLVDDFLTKSIDGYNSIFDNKKVCLNLWNDYSRFGKPSWTGINTKEVEFDGKPFHKIGWLDMCLISDRKLFDIIDFSVHRPESIYVLNKELSSGVGAQLSKRLVSAGANLYQVVKSLVKHDDHASVMHPEHRVKTPLITNHEWVTASMAAIPSRINSLSEVVNSIINQVDCLNIYLNDFEYVPEFLNHKKINCFLSKDHSGDLGDAGKFFKASSVNGYHFTLDDDIIYPTDYVKTMIHAIERHGRKYVFSFHGRKFIQKPVKSYYHSAEVKISCLKSLDQDTIIDTPGTGVMAYHTHTIQFDIKDFNASNMADIWAGKKAKKSNVKVMALEHKAGWIKMSRQVNFADTIYVNCNGRDEFQTQILNSFI